MKSADLPIGKASDPENARQPEKNINNFVHNTSSSGGEDLNMSEDVNNSIYEDQLSQPPATLTQLERLKWLQKRRAQPKLWVQCDSCDKWRYLPHIYERHQLPKKWFCDMNPDSAMASCSAAEVPIPPHEEADLVHSEYSAGSLVLARHAGWPWWPAMVDDCPDTEQYYWINELCDIPTAYNVTFFDDKVTRAWIPASHIRPFVQSSNVINTSLKKKLYRKRLEISLKQVEEAAAMDLAERLEKYCFINRYEGPVRSPKKVKKSEVKKYKDKLKRKYSVQILFESDNEVETLKTDSCNNIITLGSKKRSKTINSIDNTLSSDNNIRKHEDSIKTSDIVTSLEQCTIDRSESPTVGDLYF